MLKLQDNKNEEEEELKDDVLPQHYDIHPTNMKRIVQEIISDYRVFDDWATPGTVVACQLVLTHIRCNL